MYLESANVHITHQYISRIFPEIFLIAESQLAKNEIIDEQLHVRLYRDLKKTSGRKVLTQNISLFAASSIFRILSVREVTSG